VHPGVRTIFLLSALAAGAGCGTHFLTSGESATSVRVEVLPEPRDTLWWTRLRLVPLATNVRGIAASELDPRWCKVGELTEAAFPDPVRYGKGALEDYFNALDSGFSARGEFGGQPLDIVLGVFETCEGDAANFMLVLDAGRSPGSSRRRIVQLEKMSIRPVLMYLAADPANGAIYVPSCFQCDHIAKWLWDADAQRFESQPEPSFE
jgi:hypothetical protein